MGVYQAAKVPINLWCMGILFFFFFNGIGVYCLTKKSVDVSPHSLQHMNYRTCVTFPVVLIFSTLSGFRSQIILDR